MSAKLFLQEYTNWLFPLVALAAVFYLLEQLRPAQKGQRFSGLLVNIVYLSFILAMVIPLNTLVRPVIDGYVLASTRGGLLPILVEEQSGVARHVAFAFFFAFVWDLCHYGIHRLQHTVPILWQTHKFHHTETALNSSTQGRNHILHHAVFIVGLVPVTIIFGKQVPHAIALFLMFKFWGLFNHMNVRLDLGPLTWIISGPQWHRIHHSIEPEHLNRNYAVFFPFIDLLFGTYCSPKRGEYPKTGLCGERDAGVLREATIEPLLAWYRLSWGRRGLELRAPR